VQSFDTTGFGASLAAHFNIGDVNAASNQGGGLEQDFIAPSTGAYSFGGDVATNCPVGNNAGAFSMSVVTGGSNIFNNNLSDQVSNVLPDCTGGQTQRFSLAGTVNLNAGSSYTFMFLGQRPYHSAAGLTPDDYVDNIYVTGTAQTGTPEPSTFLLLGPALMSSALLRRKRRTSPLSSSLV
jgi:hypothetical protein